MKTRTAVAVGTAGTVIGGVVLNFLGWIPLGTWIKSAWASVVAVFTWLGTPVTLPKWVFGIVLQLALLVVVVVVAAVVSHIRESRTPAAVATRIADETARAYLWDTFFGIRWRWRMDNSGYIHTIVPFCPVCDLQVVPERESGYAAVAGIQLRCADCGVLNYRSAPSADWDQVEQEVRLRVQRNIRRMFDEAHRPPAQT